MKTKLKACTIYIPQSLKTAILRSAKANKRTFTQEAWARLEQKEVTA